MLLPNSSRLRFPGGSPATLDISHPAARKLRLACVAQPGGSMRDLLTNTVRASAGQASFEQNSLGPTCWPAPASAANSYIGFPAIIAGEVLSQITIAVIFKGPTVAAVGQGMIGDNSAGPNIKIQTSAAGGIQYSVLNVAAWTVNFVAGQDYFVCGILDRLGGSPNSRSVVVNLTTGQIWQFATVHGGTAQAVGTTYNVLTYNVGGGTNNGRVAAAMLSAGAPSRGQMMAWARDPWSLWYKRPTRRVGFLTLRRPVGKLIGDTLNVTNGVWTGSPIYAYQWKRDGVTNIGTNASSYVAQSADGGHVVSCEVTASNVIGSATAKSNTYLVYPPPPVNSLGPSITGSTTVGLSINCNPGTWSGSPIYAYQWMRNSVNIPGEIASTHIVATADQGYSVSCNVTATNAGGSASLASNALSIPYYFPAGAAAIYSTRLAVSGYLGKALQVRKSSGATQDIGFVGSDLDVAAAIAFAAGSILTVSKWYDQSGNTQDAVQATVASQPRLLIVGNRAYLSFAGTFLNTAATITLTGDQTIGCVHWAGVNTSAIYPFANFNGTNGWFLVDNQTNKQGGYYSSGAAAYRQGGNLMAKSPARLSITRTAGAVVVYLNGTNVGSGTGSNAATTGGVTIGGFNGTASFVGVISECWIYASALSVANVNAIDAAQVGYWGDWKFATPFGGSAAWVQLSANDKVDCGNILQFERTQSWTCFAAIQSWGLGTQPQIIFTNVLSGAPYTGYEMFLDQITGQLVVRIINTYTGIYIDVIGTTNLIDAKQHFVAASYDGSSVAAGIRLYVDGQPETMTTRSDSLGSNTIVASGQKMCLGWQQPGGVTMYGCLGRVQIDKVVRSASYILSYASSFPPIDPVNTGMCFPLNEGSGTTVHDITTNAYPATLNTASIWVP